MTKKGSVLNSIFYYFIFYIPFGAVCPLLSQYLSSIGFSGTEVGTITAFSTLGASIGCLFLGRIFSNTNKKKVFLLILLISCAILDIICKFSIKFLPFLLLYMFLYFFQEPVHGLSDVMLTQNGENFPLIRGFGAIGFALSSFVTGLICENLGLDKSFIIAAIAYLVASIFLFRMGEPKNFVESKSDKVKIKYLLKEKKFVVLLICSMFFMGITMANNTYFGYLYREGGGSISGIGLAFLLMAGSEALIMSIVPLVEKIFSIEKLIAIGAVFEIIRFGFYSTSPSFKWLLATFILQGLMNGILLVEFVKYFSKVVEAKYAAMSVSVFNSIGVNFSTILVNFVSGVVLDNFNVKGVYLFFAILSSIGLTIYLSFGLHKNEN